MDFFRTRRNRKSQSIRDLVQETRLHLSDFVMPCFVKEGKNYKEPILALPGRYRFSIDLLVEEVKEIACLGIPAIALFPVVEKKQKTAKAEEALNLDNLANRAISTIKEALPKLCVIADVALDPYTDHGHDGVVDDKGEVKNDETIAILAEMAVGLAKAGADIVAPSDMMDGRVKAIRSALDKNYFFNVNILSYSSKYASAFYGPFREALFSHVTFGDKQGYQMNPANKREALFEAQLDIMEGADILMVKPALPYLDVIHLLREKVSLPIAAYQVSGEYAMIKAASEKGWIDEKKAMVEALIAIKRAGADMIFTYAAKEMVTFFRG